MFQGVCSPVLCCAGMIPSCKGPGRIVCVCFCWGGVHTLVCMYMCVGAWANTQAYLGHMLVYMSTLILLVISRCCEKKKCQIETSQLEGIVREMEIVVLFTSFFFQLGPQPRERCHPHAERLFSPRLDLSRNTLIDNPS